MLSINYFSNDFPPPISKKISHNKIRISIPEIIWSAITVGREDCWAVKQHGIFSYYEMIYRIGIVYANLNLFVNHNALKKTDAYKMLDPSGKGVTSYFMNLRFNAILSNKISSFII